MEFEWVTSPYALQCNSLAFQRFEEYKTTSQWGFIHFQLFAYQFFLNSLVLRER